MGPFSWRSVTPLSPGSERRCWLVRHWRLSAPSSPVCWSRDRFYLPGWRHQWRNGSNSIICDIRALSIHKEAPPGGLCDLTRGDMTVKQSEMRSSSEDWKTLDVLLFAGYITYCC